MCNCVAKANKLLAEKNTAIATVMTIGNGVISASLCIPTRKLDKKKSQPAVSLMASFCPLCGEKITERKAVGKAVSENG